MQRATTAVGDGRMTQRYAHLTHERLASAVGTLDRVCHKSVIVGNREEGLEAVESPLKNMVVPTGVEPVS